MGRKIMKYEIVKRYGHEEGLSCVFRQFRAPETHCSKLHGYPLAFEFTFEADTLDSRNWVLSFGELKPLKQWLKDTFDHKLLVSVHDPKIAAILELEEIYDIAQVVFVEEVGCEMFAKMAFEQAAHILEEIQEQGRACYARLKCVKVSEHAGNTAIYYGPSLDVNNYKDWVPYNEYESFEDHGIRYNDQDIDPTFHGYPKEPEYLDKVGITTGLGKTGYINVSKVQYNNGEPYFQFNSKEQHVEGI
jgi:6-pyruvoyltetrahydropterin/6-carboxytetrahydropterin synthase